MSRLLTLLALLNLLLAGPVLAATSPAEMLQDPVLEARARAIGQELRCLVCQNQSIDDSDASLAHDLRVLLREQLQQGKSDAEALQFLVDRYGDYVLLKPPFKSSTMLLWLLPFGVLMAAAAFLLRRRPQAATPAEAPLSDDERKALAKQLEA